MIRLAVALIISTLLSSASAVGRQDDVQQWHHRDSSHRQLERQSDIPVSFTELMYQMQRSNGGSGHVGGSGGQLSWSDFSALPTATHGEHVMLHDIPTSSFLEDNGHQAYHYHDPSAMYFPDEQHLPPLEPVLQGANQWYGQYQLSDLPPLPPSLPSLHHYAVQNQLSLSDGAVEALQNQLWQTNDDAASRTVIPSPEQGRIHENYSGQTIDKAIFAPPVPHAKPHRRKSLQLQHERIKAQIRTLWREKEMYVGMDPRSLAMKVTEMKLQLGFPQQIGHMVGHVVRKEARAFDKNGKYIKAYLDWIARFNKKVSALRREYEYDDDRFSSDESRERMVYEMFRDTKSREDMYGGCEDNSGASASSSSHLEAASPRQKTFPPNSEQAEDRAAVSVWNNFMRLRIRPVFGSKVNIDALSITTIEEYSNGWHSEGYSTEQTTEYLKRYLHRYLLRSKQELDLFDLLRREEQGIAED